VYSDDIVSTCNLRSVISYIFSDDIAVYVPYVHLVKLNYLLLFFSSDVMLPIWWSKDEYIRRRGDTITRL